MENSKLKQHEHTRNYSAYYRHAVTSEIMWPASLCPSHSPSRTREVRVNTGLHAVAMFIVASDF
jgi:hypothetical protein